MAVVPGGAAGITAVYAALTYDIISATNSSPQTTEINAAARSETLMKWVNLGMAQAGLFVAVGIVVAVIEGEPWWPIVLGAGLAGVMLYLQYIHARDSGLKSSLPGTESYS